MSDSEQYYQGIINCFPSGSSDSYCILKTTELAISSIVLIACLIEVYNQIKTYGLNFRWKMASLALIMASLATNIAFCVWNTTYELYILESYLNNLYFVTIVAYVCRMYILKNGYDNRPIIQYGFIAILAIMGIFYSIIFIDSLLNQSNQEMVNNSCEEVWYLCINIVCLVLCLVALIVLYKNQRQQQKKIQKYNFTQSKVHNPLQSLWIWIGINTFAQIIDLVETGLLINTTQQNYCMIIPNNTLENNILMFAFAIVTMISGYLATIWYYGMNRKRSQETQQDQSAKMNDSGFISQQIRVGYGLEMLDNKNDGLLY